MVSMSYCMNENINETYRYICIRKQIKLSVHACYLFSVVSDRLDDGVQTFDADGNVEQVTSKEEVMEVAKHRERKVPQLPQK